MSLDGQTIVIAGGTGRLGTALAKRLEGRATIRLVGTRAGAGAHEWKANLLSASETEVALAGASTVVLLARSTGARARLFQGGPADLDAVIADSVARAARLVKPRRLVAYLEHENDEREALLQRAGVPFTVLSGGGDDPVSALEALVTSVELQSPRRLARHGGHDGTPALWAGPSTVLSIQRLRVAPRWSAAQAARAYFQWLPTGAPGVSTILGAEAFEVRSAGVSLLRLRRVTGQCDDDLEVLEVLDGALVQPVPDAIFEFRRIGNELFTVLRGFVPSMPWPLYRASQAPIHARTMRGFGTWLENQR